MQKYHDEPKQYKGYLKSALSRLTGCPFVDTRASGREVQMSNRGFMAVVAAAIVLMGPLAAAGQAGGAAPDGWTVPRDG